MYQNFELEGRNFRITGYHYPCENPEKVVVLIHGIGEHAGRFARMADYFGKEGIAVVSMDLRGHGQTEGKRGHCAPREEVLKDVDALIEYAQKLYPDAPVVMYGHSMGGNITLDYRARGEHNDVPCGYIISAPWIRLVRPVTGVLFQTVKLLSKLMPQMTISQAFPEEQLGNVEYVRPYKDDPKVHSKVSMLCAYEGFTIGTALEKGENEDNGRAKNISCLLMHGTGDKICDIEGSRCFARFQDPEYFTMIEWPGYYHEIHNGGPDGQTGEEVILKAIEFIKGL
ncbi:MAG: lysophospholipase [Firmicutes bacterium]|nr:lysophospholipase [Bacillota bacterium]